MAYRSTERTEARRAETRARITSAALALVAEGGYVAAQVAPVAERAGVAVGTVYRYFPSKDHLVLALVLREEEKFIDGTRRAFEENEDLDVAMERAMTFTLRFAHEHPLLDRLLATDAQTFLPYLTTQGLPVVTRAREAAVELLRERRPDLDEDELRGLFDVSARATLSYILTPSERSPERIARTMARTLSAAIAESGKRGVS
jgi:AcrR family transcriptional regulator